MVENDLKETFDGPSNFNTNNDNKGVFIGGVGRILEGSGVTTQILYCRSLFRRTPGRRLQSATAMIRNGLYFYSSKARDGVDGGADGVMILRDGKMFGGTEFFYFVGTYSCSNGKWKGEFTNEEHTPAPITRPMARKGTVSIGFSGTYTDKDAQFELTALIGKRSLQYHAIMRLLVAD